MQVKINLDFHITPVRMPRNVHACKDMVQGKHSSNAGSNTNLYNQLENQYVSVGEYWESIYFKA